MRRPTALAAVLASASLLLAGCDSGGEPDSGEPEEVVPTSQNPEREETPEDLEDVEGHDGEAPEGGDEAQDGPGSDAEGTIGGDGGIAEDDQPG